MRDPRVTDPAYMAWVARLPCVACLVLHGRVNREVQVAHLRFGLAERGFSHTGMQQKPHDRRTLPLCMPHHTGDRRAERISQHHMAEEVFWRDALGLDVFDLVLALNAAYDAGQPGYAVIARFAGAASPPRRTPDALSRRHR